MEGQRVGFHIAGSYHEGLCIGDEDGKITVKVDSVDFRCVPVSTEVICNNASQVLPVRY